MASLCVGEDFCEELTCAVCLDSWKDPVELSPCGHIFCKACVDGLKECPVCRDRITTTKTPNRTLVNMALQISVKCMRCGWKGKREQGMSHVCGSTGGNAAAAPALSALVVPSILPPTSPPTQQLGPYEYGNYDDLWTSGQPSAATAPAPAPPPPAAAPPARPSGVIEPTGPRPWTLYGLGQEEYDQIVSLFVFFDEDESGALDRKEVARLARWLNFANSPQDVDRIFNDMDADRTGRLSLGEFLTWLRHNKPNPQALYGLTQSQYNTIMMQFHTYSGKQDGLIELNEFARLVLHLGEVRDMATAQRLFRMIDRDRDGAISLHEFLLFRAGRM